jgi:hypothetical protein
MKNVINNIKAPDEWVSENDWDSHRELLWLVMNNTYGRVIELGVGYGSSSVLEKYCQNTNRQLFSLETNKQWSDKFKNSILVDNYDKATIFTPCDVIFVDSAPGENRKNIIEVFANMANIIAVHDTELGAEYVYGMSEILSTFKYRLNYEPVGKPHTTVVSNFIDVTKWVA